MRVLFVCGHGRIENAIPTIKQRLKGSVDLDTLGSLDDLDSYFAKGYTFDKCVILSPDRLIPNYTPELLEGEMMKFKKTISSKCSARVDIIMCVVNEEDGLQLAELFSDMLGEITILQVGSQLKITDLIDLIVQQGTTLSNKFKSYDLTTIAKNVAKERMNDIADEGYKSLDDLVQESMEQEAPEEVITPLGSDIEDEDNDDSFADNFNPDGFSDDTFESNIPDDFFGGSSPDSDISDDIFSGFNSDDSNRDIDESAFGNMEDVSGNVEDGFGEIKEEKSDNDDSDIDFEFGGSNADIEILDKKPEKQKTQGLSMFSGNNSNINNSKLKKSPSKEVSENKNNKEKKEKKPLFVFGSKKKQDTPQNNINNKDDCEYELNQKKEVKPKLIKGKTIEDEKDSSVKTEIKEVSNKKNIGLSSIKKPSLKKEPVYEEVKSDIDSGFDEYNNDNMVNSEMMFEEESEPVKQTSSKGLDMTPGGVVDATNLFDLDDSSKQEIERGQGEGLNTNDLGTGRKKVGKKVDKNLQELLKPYLKRGGLFVITGSHGAGKTVVSANIANLLCRYGYRVCVLDLDLQGKGQSYINLDTFRTVHGGFQTKMNSLNVVNSTGTEFAKWTDVVKSGFHVITTTLNSDVEETGKLVRNTNMGRLIRQLTGAYNFVVVDVDFHDLVTYYKDFSDTADIILSVEEATQRGLTNFMLNMINIEDEDVENTMFNRVCLVLNKEDGMKSFFGKKVNKTSDILVTLDDTVTALAQQVIDYTFTDIPVVGILKYSNVYEKFWYTNKYITDTKDGDKIFSELLQNALNN